MNLHCFFNIYFEFKLGKFGEYFPEWWTNINSTGSFDCLCSSKTTEKRYFYHRKIDHVTEFFCLILKMLHQEWWLQHLFKHFHSKFYFDKNILWSKIFLVVLIKNGYKKEKWVLRYYQRIIQSFNWLSMYPKLNR